MEPRKVLQNEGDLYIFTCKCASRYSGVQFLQIATSKMLACGGLYILTYKCASRHSGVPILQITTSKMAPTLRCFVHFDVHMCFAPQRRANFADRNFQNGSAPECFVHFDMQMCFAPQQRAIFRFSRQQLPPHPPLYRGYFSIQPKHKTLQNTAFRDFSTFSRLCIF